MAHSLYTANQTHSVVSTKAKGIAVDFVARVEVGSTFWLSPMTASNAVACECSRSHGQTTLTCGNFEIVPLAC